MEEKAIKFPSKLTLENTFWLYWQKHTERVERSDSPPVFVTYKTTSSVICSDLGSLAHGHWRSE